MPGACEDSRQEVRMRGTAQSDECRDRVQNRMATDLGEADRYKRRNTSIGSEENKIRLGQTVGNCTVNVETLGTVQIEGSSGSSAGAAQSSSACAAKPFDQ